MTSFWVTESLCPYADKGFQIQQLKNFRGTRKFSPRSPPLAGGVMLFPLRRQKIATWVTYSSYSSSYFWGFGSFEIFEQKLSLKNFAPKNDQNATHRYFLASKMPLFWKNPKSNGAAHFWFFGQLYWYLPSKFSKKSKFNKNAPHRYFLVPKNAPKNSSILKASKPLPKMPPNMRGNGQKPPKRRLFEGFYPLTSLQNWPRKSQSLPKC